MIQVWVPHEKKLSVAEGHRRFGDAFDPADPPLADGQMDLAQELTDELVDRFGAPAMIFHSPMLRCIETAAPAIARFGQLHQRGGVLTVGLNSLAQPENGDYDPNNPTADEHGLVYYGGRSTSDQWLEWFRISADCISRLAQMHASMSRRKEPIYVFTHRPLVAAARFVVRRGIAYGLERHEKLDPLDPTLLPYCIFNVTGSDWREMPK